ncbi:chloride channel protein [Serpentinicella alkaliphila]|uniref:CIC family chloride channel protein n=1 Tax=Serpentinicella alkaliphila TaxID=1734049 RepID=A0A4R2TFG3_9FIRM|nr:chloride channel protein [Serpentinicella alkaliphila]QUH24893.1 chloride channel protein [Serpentinicella alkaliphila]TCQ01831.1 CIC family chloride channel protein [Serpentinicella alkaliphila]
MLVIGSSMTEGILKIIKINELFTDEERRTLMICGAAGAIGAIFRSPLGGGVFVVEVLYRSSLHYTELFPAMLSSTMGYVIYSMVYKSTPFFQLPNYLPNVFNVPLFIFASILAGIVSLIFINIFKWTQDLFNNRIKSNINPFIWGLLTGIVLIFIPKVAGKGTDIIQELITGQMTLGFLMLIIIGKMLATSFTVASGGSAGLVITALFLGAATGNCLSVIVGAESGLSSSLVIAGMTASLAGIANVPLAAAIMLVEMVGLRIAIPATLGSIIGYAIGHNRVIYGVTNPDHWQYEYMNKWKEDDRKLKEH